MIVRETALPTKLRGEAVLLLDRYLRVSMFSVRSRVGTVSFVVRDYGEV